MTSEPSGHVLKEWEKIQILLHEYDTLRTEIINRTGFGFQLTAIGVAFLGVMITQGRSIVFWCALVVGLAVMALSSWWNVRDIWKAAERLRELERDINKRAREDLLQYESFWGAAAAGWFGRSRPLPGRPGRSN
jgi:hypothetical protein